MQIEMVNTGLLFKGDVLFAGQVVEFPENIFKTPEEQMDQMNKVFYVEVGSAYDKTFIKQSLSRGDSGVLANTGTTLIEPSFTRDGEEMVGIQTQEEVTLEDKVNLQQMLREQEEQEQAETDVEEVDTDDEEEAEEEPVAEKPKPKKRARRKKAE